MHHFTKATCFVTALIVLATGPLFARDQLYSIGVPSEAGSFNVIDGTPYLLRKGEHGSPGNALDLKNGKNLIHFDSEKALCYPLDGEDPSVSLGKNEGKSADWDVPPGGESQGLPIRAAKGKLKGWYLDWTDEETEVKSSGKTYHVRKLILTKDPKPPKLFSKYPVAP